MPNPFMVLPQADITQGLSGLSSVLKENREARKQQEINDAAQIEIQEALQSNDPLKLAQLSVKFPQLRESIENVTGIVSEQQKREATAFMTEVLSNPDNAQQAFMRRIEQIEDGGGDPSNTIQSFQDYLNNPEAELDQIRMLLAGTDPDSFKALDEGEGFTLAKGAARFDPEGEQIAANIPEEATDRKTARDSSGRLRFEDTGDFVFADVPQEEMDRETAKDVNDRLRFTDTGELVFPEVQEQAEAPKAPTSGQRLAAGFAERTQAAGDVITELGEQFTGLASRAVGVVPSGARTQNRQVFDQAVRNFINATLRRESGAAIAPSEFENANLQYIPQPGDKADVLEQKQKNRETISASLQLEAGSAFGELHSVLHPTVIINGEEYDVGQIVENDQEQQGRVEADGTITRL